MFLDLLVHTSNYHCPPISLFYILIAGTIINSAWMHKKLLIIIRQYHSLWRQRQELRTRGQGVSPWMVRQAEMARRSITGLRESDQGASRDQWGVGPITSWVTRGDYASQTKYPAAWRHQGGALGVRGGNKGKTTGNSTRVLAEHQLSLIQLFI